MKIDAYVFYNGDCEEAFQFYKSALGGELSINRYQGSPMESEVPAAVLGREVRHVDRQVRRRLDDQLSQ